MTFFVHRSFSEGGGLLSLILSLSLNLSCADPGTLKVMPWRVPTLGQVLLCARLFIMLIRFQPVFLILDIRFYPFIKNITVRCTFHLYENHLSTNIMVLRTFYLIDKHLAVAPG